MGTTKSFGYIILIFALLAGFPACSQQQKKATPIEIGKPAPDFSLQDTAGKTWRLQDLQGKVVFVNFWATWCPPCREEMPSMERLKQLMEGKDFTMLSILSNDDPATAVNFAGKAGLTFPVLIDPDSAVARAYGITGVPETFIIGPDSILRRKFIGPRQWDSAAAVDMLREYL